MSILSDYEIAERCNFKKKEEMMIWPFSNKQVRKVNGNKIVSYGLSSYGYDVRCGDWFTKEVTHPEMIDDTGLHRYSRDVKVPENSLEWYSVSYLSHDDGNGKFIVIPANGFALTHTIEYIRVPRDILVICLGKSTYARVGIVANITPLEPEWEGQITIELSNTSPYPVKIYANEGIAQLVFHKADRVCKTSYKDKKGKYQGQTGVTGAKV